ncbi:MAG: CsgG/HfaB family protein [Acidobacteriota bacterium]
MKRTTSLLLLLLLAVVAASPAFANDKPRIAVLEFENRAASQYWWSGGGPALQNKLVTELVKSGKFRVIEREQLAALMREKNLSLSGDINPSTAIQAGRLLGVDYFLTGAVTEYGVTDKGGSGFGISIKKRDFTAGVDARLINTETGEIIWADDASAKETTSKVRVRGVGGGVDDQRMFDKVMKPIVGDLVASLKAADM